MVQKWVSKNRAGWKGCLEPPVSFLCGLIRSNRYVMRLVMAAQGHSPLSIAVAQLPVWSMQTGDQVGTYLSFKAVCVEKRSFVINTGSSLSWKIVSGLASNMYLKEG